MLKLNLRNVKQLNKNILKMLLQMILVKNSTHGVVQQKEKKMSTNTKIF